MEDLKCWGGCTKAEAAIADLVDVVDVRAGGRNEFVRSDDDADKELDDEKPDLLLDGLGTTTLGAT